MTAPAALGPEELRRGLQNACLAVIAASPTLTALDAVAGDGDLGTSMELAFTALQDALDAPGDSDVSALLTLTGTTIQRAAPSTLGTLLGLAFRDAGRVSVGTARLDGPGLVMVLRVMTEGIARRGRVEAGQRTIVDAMLASGLAAAQAAAQAGGDPVAVLRAASAGAGQGAKATAEMAPVKGRAAWIGERVRGSPDAGATAWQVILEGLYQGVAAQAT